MWEKRDFYSNIGWEKLWEWIKFSFFGCADTEMHLYYYLFIYYSYDNVFWFAANYRRLKILILKNFPCLPFSLSHSHTLIFYTITLSGDHYKNILSARILLWGSLGWCTEQPLLQLLLPGSYRGWQWHFCVSFLAFRLFCMLYLRQYSQGEI